MLLDWFYNIFDFANDFSPSLPNRIESKNGLVYDVRVISSDQLEPRVLGIGIDAPSIKL
jgi:hypothetical protein